jgi:anti-anti-sigma regulatory factor
MPFSITNSDGRQILKLEGAVTIRHAQDLAVKLAEGLEDGTPVGVDTGGLEDIDTCILQLLSSLRKTVPALSFDDPSEAFFRAVDRCGLRRDLLSEREGL